MMLPRSRIARYGLALLFVLMATALRLALGPGLGGSHFFAAFYLAVIASAWCCGLGPSVLSLGLGALAGFAMMNGPMGQRPPGPAADGLGVALYVGVGLAFIAFGEARRRGLLRSDREAVAKLRAENDAREGREQLRIAVESAEIGTWDHDPASGSLRWSERCQVIFGLDPGSEVTYDRFLGILHPEDRDRVDRGFRAAIEVEGGTYESDYRCLGPGGSERWIVARGRAIFEGSGPTRRAVRFIGTALDITQRKRDEEAISEHARLALYGRDVGTALTRAATLGEMLGRCVEATVSHLDAAFARIWTADESGAILELQASAGIYTHLDGPHGRIPVGSYKIGQIAESRRPHLTNAVVGDPKVPSQDWARAEGMVGFAGYPLVVESRLIGVIAMFARREIPKATFERLGSVADEIALGIERKRAEERLHRQREWLRVTLASVGDAVITTDTEGRVTFLNAVAEGLTGWDRAEAAGVELGEVFRIVDESTRLPAACPIARALREGIVVGLANHTILIRKDGSEVAIDDSAAPIRDEDGDGPIIGAVLVFRDVSRKRQAERELERSEARKGAILRSALDAIITIDHEGRVLEWNPAAEQTFGIDPGHAIGQIMADLIIPEEYREAHRQGLAHFLATGEGPILGQRVEITAFRSSGGTFPVEMAITRILGDGPPVFTGHIRDITERKRAEVVLRESEARYRALIEVSPQVVWEGSPDGRISYVNARWTELTGLGPEQSEGDGWVAAIPPEHRERALRTWREAARRVGPYEMEIPFRRASDGQERWHLARWIPTRDESGQVARWVGVAIDIHEIKRAEQRLAFLAEAGVILAGSLDYRATLGAIARLASDGFADFCIFELALDGDRVEPVAWAHADPGILGALERTLGSAPARPAQGHPAGPTIAGGGTAIIAEVPEDRMGPAAPDPGHLDWLRSLGLHSLVIVPVPAPGRILGALSFGRSNPGRTFDEADIRLAEDLGRRAGVSLNNATLFREAEDANKAKDQFLAVLSHELRTPLNPILLATSAMLERPADPDELRATLEMIRQNVNLQARLIDDLLDVMRIVRGKMPLHWEVADGHRLIHQAHQISRSELFGKFLKLEFDLGAADHHVNADPARLQQVFWNLIKNAVKFTPEGGTITVRTRNQPDRGGPAGRLVVEVSDTGIGIDPEILTRIFDPFQQGETTITRRFGGLGLGLAICKGIVEAHGGTIEVESAGRDRGTTFRVGLDALPRSAIEPEEGPEEAGPPARVTFPSTLRILIVEDEPATLRLMARLIRGLGHEVATASTIAAGLATFEAGRFDLVVSDIGLPDGSGLELMRNVVARRGAVPAIALTGYGMEEDIRRSREAGFTAHLTKPIDFVKLEAMIQQIAPVRP